MLHIFDLEGAAVTHVVGDCLLHCGLHVPEFHQHWMAPFPNHLINLPLVEHFWYSSPSLGWRFAHSNSIIDELVPGHQTDTSSTFLQPKRILESDKSDSQSSFAPGLCADRRLSIELRGSFAEIDSVRRDREVDIIIERLLISGSSYTSAQMISDTSA